MHARLQPQARPKAIARTAIVRTEIVDRKKLYGLVEVSYRVNNAARSNLIVDVNRPMSSDSHAIMRTSENDLSWRGLRLEGAGWQESSPDLIT